MHFTPEYPCMVYLYIHITEEVPEFVGASQRPIDDVRTKNYVAGEPSSISLVFQNPSNSFSEGVKGSRKALLGNVWGSTPRSSQGIWKTRALSRSMDTRVFHITSFFFPGRKMLFYNFYYVGKAPYLHRPSYSCEAFSTFSWLQKNPLFLQPYRQA